MQFEHVRIPAVDPPAQSVWYGSLFGASPVRVDESEAATAVGLGETTVQFVAADDPPPAHLAVRLLAEADHAVDWLTEQVSVLPVDGESSRWFEFLEATAIYFDDPEANVLEGLCYAGDPREPTTDEWVDGVTEVGLPARETLRLVEWLEETVGLSAWGTPGDTFGWVGDRHARFVVVPAGRDWYPTERNAGITPISVTIDASTAVSGRHVHPTLPYEIVVD